MPKEKGKGKSVFDGLLSAAKHEQEQKSSPNVTNSHSNLSKRQNPDYRQTTIYVKKELHRKVKRLLEDSGYEGDFSDWVEKCMLREVANHQTKTGTK